MKVFDNIISKKQQEEIKNFIYGKNFPWYFTADISYDSNKHQARPGHFHNFVKEGKINSEYVSKIKQILLLTY